MNSGEMHVLPRQTSLETVIEYMDVNMRANEQDNFNVVPILKKAYVMFIRKLDS